MSKYKAILIGDSGAGKSTLIQRITTGKFTEDIPETVGTEYFTKRYDNRVINLWDTLG